MNWKELFQMQYTLDKRIADDRGIEMHEMFEERINALLVEIGELANEERSFKFWSNKPRSTKKVILEEFVDCVHFLLSLGNFKGFNRVMDMYKIDQIHRQPMPILFNNTFEAVIRFRERPTSINYIEIWDYLLSIADQLGFDHGNIYDAYIIKNAINHDRQDNNY